MVARRDLSAPPGRQLADIVSGLRAEQAQSKTGAAGVTDYGETGDVRWTRPDAPEFTVSIRDIDGDLQDAQGRIEDAEGDLAEAQARVDTALDAEGHIREDEILRNATLLGDTVVEQINVTGKLIGKDGVFTGTVDFENVNVTGLQLVEKLEANSISADLIEGGHFTGETFEGGSFVGGEFRTSDDLPGRVTLADDAYINSTTGGAHPGIRVEPLDTSDMARPPGIGPGDQGL